MSHPKAISRRKAMRIGGATVAAVAAGSQVHSPAHRAIAGPLGALDRLRVGVIGTGVRGKYLIGNLPESASVVSICDCAGSRMAETLEPKKEFVEILSAFSSGSGRRCSTHKDYRRMFDRERFDAVIIATPDHHHVQAAMLALQAGLDVYLEKPLTVTIREGRLLADMVSKSGRVLQVGSQQRTMETNRVACEFIRDGGLGKVSSVDFPNYPGPIGDPQFPAEATPDGLDWDLFLGPTRVRPHNRKLWVKDAFKVGDLTWRGWDLFRDYSGHLMTNWGAHSIDMVQYALGMDQSGPTKISPSLDVSDAALERDWQENWYAKTPRPRPRPKNSWRSAARFRPVNLTYPGGTELRLRPGIDAATFHGERGTMVISRNKFKTDPHDLVKDGPDPEEAKKWDGQGHVARPHLQNWIDCIRSRDVPNAPIEVGHRTITVCHLVNIARELNRTLHWDPKSEQFPDDAEANGLLSRPRREGFQLPSV
jgi:predicted dehydrogenase